MPRKSVTVCAGTSWENATRKEICKGIVPLIEVRLEVSVNKLPDRRRRTHDHFISPVIANNVTKALKVNTLGTREATSRNFTNSFDVQALSRYRPP